MKQSFTVILVASLAWSVEAAVIRYDRMVNGPVAEPTSWIGGAVPGPDDLVWIDKVTDSGTADYVTFTFTNDTAWGGIYLQATNKELKLTLANANGAALILGQDGIKSATSNIKGLDINVPIRLACDTELDFYGTASLTQPIELGGYALRLGGTATKQFKNMILGPGRLMADTSFQVLNDNILSNVDVQIVGDGGEVEFFGANVLSRMHSLTGSAAVTRLHFYNNTYTAASTNAVTAGLVQEHGEFWLTAEQTRPAQYVVRLPSFTRQSGALFLTGTALGVYGLDEVSADKHSAIVMDDAPALVGGLSGPACPIIPGTFIDTNGTVEGFATYEAGRGVRMLDAKSEYDTSITDGQTEPTNVRFDNCQAGPMVTALAQPLTVINSLLINETGYGYTTGGTNSSGVVITGADGTTLRVVSGTIFANQALTVPATNDVMALDVPNLDLNGQDGVVFIKGTAGTSNGSCNAPFSFRSIPTNTSANGIGFYGYNGRAGGYVFIEGDHANTYTGRTVVGSTVYCKLNRSTANTAIRGTLVIDGGTCQYNNQLDDDTADLVVLGGFSVVKTGASNSGNGGTEVFRDLTMFGGNHSIGGGGGGSTTMRSARLYGGSFTLGRGAVGSVSNGLMMVGGTLNIGSTTDSSRWGGFLDVAGGMVVSNTAENMSYTPVNVGYSTIRRPCTLRLNDSLTVVGNAVNTNPVVFARNDYAGSFPSALGLDGSIEIAVTDGAAACDFDCELDVVNGDSSAGTLVKTGSGTLLLSAPTNGLTGGVQVNAGTLVSAAVFTNVSFAVAGGASLVTCGGMSIHGEVAFEPGSILGFQGTGAVLAVTGALTGSGNVTVDVEVPADNSDRLLVTATGGIAPDFATSNAKWTVVKKAGGTELWLHKRADGLKIIICDGAELTIPYRWITNACPSIAADDDMAVSNALVSVGVNGLVRWQSYALGLDPNDASSVVLCDVRQEAAADRMTFFARNVEPVTNDTLSIAYVLEGSRNGTSWSDIMTSSSNSLPVEISSLLRFSRIRTDIILL